MPELSPNTHHATDSTVFLQGADRLCHIPSAAYTLGSPPQPLALRLGGRNRGSGSWVSLIRIKRSPFQRSSYIEASILRCGIQASAALARTDFRCP